MDKWGAHGKLEARTQKKLLKMTVDKCGQKLYCLDFQVKNLPKTYPQCLWAACVRGCASLLPAEHNERYQHFFERDAAVLKGVFVVFHVMVKVVGIGKKVLVARKNIGRTEV